MSRRANRQPIDATFCSSSAPAPAWRRSRCRPARRCARSCPTCPTTRPTTVKLGPPAEFPDGLKFLPDERVLVFRDGNTFHAISAVCTHLGCTVRAEALSNPQTTDADGAPLRLTHRFLCPCHGSEYKGDGTNVAGPAPKPLAWFRLLLAPDDGQLVIDLADEVGRDFRLTLG